jgi:pyruvate,water dikinase
VRFPRELVQCRRWVEEEGLTRHPGFRLWMMAEVPSNVLLIDEFLPHADGVSIGTNDLTQLVLGIDRDSHRLAAEFDERDPAVLAAIARIVTACRARGVPVSMCGDAPSRHPDLVVRLVELGIGSLSVSAEAFEATVAAVREAERRQDAAHQAAGRGG